MTQTLKTIYADRRLRIVEAAKRAGLNAHQVARKANWGMDFTRAAFEEADETLDGEDIIQLAEALHVDARWLAIGASSPAAVAAMAEVEYLHGLSQNRFHALAKGVVKELTRLLAMTPQPIPDFGGVCRYCNCTDDMACDEGCAWVDAAATICSACLEPLEPEAD